MAKALPNSPRYSVCLFFFLFFPPFSAERRLSFSIYKLVLPESLGSPNLLVCGKLFLNAEGLTSYVGLLSKRSSLFSVVLRKRATILVVAAPFFPLARAVGRFRFLRLIPFPSRPEMLKL